MQCGRPGWHTGSLIGKDRDPLIRDPLFLSLLSLIKAILSLIDSYDSYISLLSPIKAILHRVSKWGSLSFPMTGPESREGHDPLRPVHLLRVFLLRVLESNFPGDSLYN